MDDGLGDAEPERAGDGVRRADRHAHLGPKPQQPLGIDEHLAPFGGRVHRAGFSVEQANAEFCLELRDTLRDRRLRGIELVGGAPKTTQRRDPDKGLQRSKVEQGSS